MDAVRGHDLRDPVRSMRHPLRVESRRRLEMSLGFI
jgi:hypothetical protein